MEETYQQSYEFDGKMRFRNKYRYVPESACDSRVQRFTHGRHTDVSGITTIAMPINITNTHWVCGVIDIAAAKVEIWDSLDFGDSVDKMGDALIQWINDVRKMKDLASIKFTFKKHTYPKQGNLYDCGVYALMCLEATLGGMDKKYGQDDAKRLRQNMLRR